MKYCFKLFLIGHAANGKRAVHNFHRVADVYLKNRFSLEVIDILENPEMTITERIMATPALVQVYPGPKKKIIGDLSKSDRFMSWLGVDPIEDINALSQEKIYHEN